MTPLFSRSGQCRTDHDVDPTVREDPEYPRIYDSHYFVTGKWVRVLIGGTDPMVMVKRPPDVGQPHG
jgi:hypothetical protein